jgi:hypothetical protein
VPASVRQRCHAVLASCVTLATAAVVSPAASLPALAADTWIGTGSDRSDPLAASQGLTWAIDYDTPQRHPARDRDLARFCVPTDGRTCTFSGG